MRYRYESRASREQTVSKNARRRVRRARRRRRGGEIRCSSRAALSVATRSIRVARSVRRVDASAQLLEPVLLEERGERPVELLVAGQGRRDVQPALRDVLREPALPVVFELI